MKVRYEKTLIYKLCCKDPNIVDIYVGHTTDFKSRCYSHKKSCNNPNDKNYNEYKYQFIRANGGWDNWDMIIIKTFSCGNKREAEAEENRIMRELKATLNKYRPFITQDEKKEYYKKYNEEHKDEINERQKQYYYENKDEISEQKKQYREEHKDELKKKHKQYYDENKDELKKKQNVRVICEFCCSEIIKRNLSRHKNNKKCLAIQAEIVN